MTEGIRSSKKEQKTSEGAGVMGVVAEAALGAVRGWFDAARFSVERAIADAVSRIVRQVFVIFLALLGVAFLLFGLAKTLSYLFQTPGTGEVVVGFIVLILAFILSLFTTEKK